MNITDACVDDPRGGDNRGDVLIRLRVDEHIQEIGDPKVNKKFPDWRVIPCGPFVAVESRDYTHPGWTDVTDLGTFNTTGIWREQLIAVKVMSPGETLDLQIGVLRARRLLRKYDPQWIILSSENAALQGRLLWRIEYALPKCLVRSCGLVPVQTVWYSGAHIPMCQSHLQLHEANLRVNRLSKIR